jgi:enterochelin esterase family protein
MTRLVLSLLAVAASLPAAVAQQPPRPRPPAVVSPEVKDGKDGKKAVTFRLLAPKAEKVLLATSDIPSEKNPPEPRELKKGENGVWEYTLDVAPGAYRYQFNIDGATAADSKNTATSESNGTVWSLVRVPGAAWMDTTDVPHGAVASITYKSSTLGKNRRAHVYTPPGYEAGTDKYPVFYLLHGAGDCDHSWTSVGRAHDILDNLIAAKKAKPMIVVMPAGHTGPFTFGGPPAPGGQPPARFEDDFEKDLRPHIEKTYRVKTDRADRAVAGLSMGGGQTLSLFMSKPSDYSAVGVFSSGLFVQNMDDWEKQNKEKLAAAAKDGPKVFWLATGKDDFLLQRTKETVALFKKAELKPEYKETEGGHTWICWQQYLNEFVPMLFK